MNNQKKLIYLLLSFLLCGQVASAQSGLSLDRFTLRKSFQSKADKAEPAYINLTAPTDEKASYSIQFALGYQVPIAEDRLEFYPFMELNRNNQQDKEQNTLLIGATGDWTPLDLSSAQWSPVILSTFNYKKDRVADSNELQADVRFTPLFRGKGMNPSYFWIPNITSDFFGLAKFYYSPYIGVEYGHASEGDVVRGAIRIKGSILPFPDLLQERLELVSDFFYRYDISDSIEMDDSEHPLYQATVAFLLFKDGSRSAGIGIDYVKGEDPTRGFLEQELYRVTFKVLL